MGACRHKQKEEMDIGDGCINIYVNGLVGLW